MARNLAYERRSSWTVLPPGPLFAVERFVCLEDRRWADELAKAYDVKVLHHAQHFKLKEDLL